MVGRGWDAYVQGANKLVDPVVGKPLQGAIRQWAVAAVEEAYGFWILWQIHGGFEGLSGWVWRVRRSSGGSSGFAC